jgi:HlyD family secretion protein
MTMKWQWNRRRAIIAAVVAVVLLLIVLSQRPAAVLVDTAEVARGTLSVLVEEDGRTRAVDRYVVTAPVSGMVERIDLREGVRVQRGAVLALVQPMPLDAPTESALRAGLTAAQARHASAAAARSQAAAAREQAQRELERRRDLVEQGALSAEQLEQFALALRMRTEELQAAEQGLRAAAADVDAARAALLSARTGSSTAGVSVRAPADGVLLRIAERSARIVSAGTPLVEVGDPNALEVVVDVLTTEAVRIRPGMRAALRNWGGEPIGGTVRLVEPSAFTRVSALGVEEQRVNVVLDLDQRPPELGDGYRVDAAITVWSAGDVLIVPAAALFRTGGGWSAFVAEGGRARLREVRVGERSGTHAQVVSGLEQGEQVILFPAATLEDGQRVR